MYPYHKIAVFQFSMGSILNLLVLAEDARLQHLAHVTWLFALFDVGVDIEGIEAPTLSGIGKVHTVNGKTNIEIGWPIISFLVGVYIPLGI